MATVDVSSRLFREIFLAGFMAGLPAENVKWAAAKLAPNMSDVHLRAGETLYRQGELPEAHWFVVTGAIRLEADGVEPRVLADRSLVGTIDVLLARPRSRNAVAMRDSFLLQLPAADWLDMLEDNFELTMRAIAGIADGVNALRLELDSFESAPASIPDELLPMLEGPLGFVDRVLLLRRLPFLATAQMQALSNVAELAQESLHEPGDVLVRRGHPSDALHIVLGGEVTATRADGRHPETYGPGMVVFGALAATPRDLGYEARAVTATRTLLIHREDFYDAMEEHFGLARSVMRSLVTERELLMTEKEHRAASGKV